MDAIAAGQCEIRPEIAEPCYQTRGRLQASNGNPGIRMWKVGTKRILGVRDGDYDHLPDPIKRHIAFGVLIFADFIVCPLTKEKPGHMQIVCIESATSIRIEDYRVNEEPTVIFPPDVQPLHEDVET